MFEATILGEPLPDVPPGGAAARPAPNGRTSKILGEANVVAPTQKSKTGLALQVLVFNIIYIHTYTYSLHIRFLLMFIKICPDDLH